MSQRASRGSGYAVTENAVLSQVVSVYVPLCVTCRARAMPVLFPRPCAGRLTEQVLSSYLPRAALK